MSLVIGDNFSYQGAKPLDNRLQFETIADMKSYMDSSLYDGILSFCKEDRTIYIFDTNNDDDVDTGRWRKFLQSANGSAFITKKELENHATMTSHITEAERSAWNRKANASQIPTKLVDLTDDANQVSILNKFGEKPTGELTFDSQEVITKISPDDGNQIDTKDNGLYVAPVEEEVETITYTDFLNLSEEEKGSKLRVVTGIPDEDGTTYSSEELPTGETWVDGKAIYHKSVMVALYPNATTASIEHKIENLGNVISISGFVISGDITYPVPFVDGTNDISAWVDGANIKVLCKSDRSTYTGYIILKYTKTTI